MKVLILTNSLDGSSDIIVKILKKKNIKFLRWNIDLWDKYEIYFNQNYFEISDPLNNSVSTKDKLKILWRKPITDYMYYGFKDEEKNPDHEYAKSEIRSVLHSIISITRESKKKSIFIDPIDEFNLPKLKQLSIAKKYFKILPYEFSILKKNINFKKSVTKPLGNSMVGKKIMYTSLVDQDKVIRPYPWFFQEALIEGKDVTSVFIKDESFFFYCDFNRKKNAIDWRKEINTSKQSKWFPLKHKFLNSLKKNNLLLMKKFKLNYGRLDFIQKGDDFYFLECNPNGQFGWLDNPKTYYLHSKFVDAFLKY